VDDRSCLPVYDILVLGEVDAKEYLEIVSVVKASHPRDAILLVRRAGRYADVLTGGNCKLPGGGGGDIYLLRREQGKWQVKGTTAWH
jgi:hypothetical protein